MSEDKKIIETYWNTAGSLNHGDGYWIARLQTASGYWAVGKDQMSAVKNLLALLYLGDYEIETV